MVGSSVSPDSTLTRLRIDEEHRALEARLAELGRHIGLTAAEKDEYRRLKRRKLLAKDRLRALGVTPGG
jgi:hypothetical protein